MVAVVRDESSWDEGKEAYDGGRPWDLGRLPVLATYVLVCVCVLGVTLGGAGPTTDCSRTTSGEHLGAASDATETTGCSPGTRHQAPGHYRRALMMKRLVGPQAHHAHLRRGSDLAQPYHSDSKAASVQSVFEVWVPAALLCCSRCANGISYTPDRIRTRRGHGHEHEHKHKHRYDA